MRRMSRSPSLREFIIYEDRPRAPLCAAMTIHKRHQVWAARGTFNRPPSGLWASTTVTIITQGTTRASLTVRTDTDRVATQESPRDPGGACGSV